MKGIMFIMAVFALNIAGYAQKDVKEVTGEASSEKYCIKLRDGKLSVMLEGKIITSEVALDNGWILRPDATVLKKDGTTISLSEGQCIALDGTIYAREKRSRHE